MRDGLLRAGEGMTGPETQPEADERGRAGSIGRLHLAATVALLGAGLGACASSGTVPRGTPVDAGEVASRAEAASTLDGSYRLMFDWNITEPGARFGGQGVARIEPPASVRLDLFSNRGERVAVAALIGDDLRLPSYDQTELPPAPFLWASLGVFFPGASDIPEGGWVRENGTSELRYVRPDGEQLVFRFSDDRIRRMEALRDGRAREELRLVLADGERFPREAVYRHLEEVRELRINLESVEYVDVHPTDIWDPGN